MSIERAKLYLEKINTDFQFREKMGKAENNKERKKIVTEAGFDFTTEELYKAMADLDIETGGVCWYDGCYDTQEG